MWAVVEAMDDDVDVPHFRPDDEIVYELDDIRGNEDRL